MSTYKDLRSNRRYLMGPGPSDVHARVLKAMSTPMIGHLDPEFVSIMDDIKIMVQQTLRTENALTFVISAPGSAGMESCLVNLLEPGDEAVICINGVFGMRMADIAERCGAKVIKVESPWGQPILPEQVELVLRTCSPKLVSVVHAETSTGVRSPIEDIAPIVHQAGALMVVDAVTSYCGLDIRMDEWGIDALYSGSQKCLSAPPGLSPVSFSPKAVEAIEKRKTKVQSWFMDLNLVRSYWSGSKRTYHHTGPVSAMYAMREALRLVLEEDLDDRIVRHYHTHLLLRGELEQLGIEFLVAEPFRLPMLNAVKIPEGVDDLIVRTKLLNEYNLEIGAGLGQFAGKVWRIGLMGESCTPVHVNLLSSALKQIMSS